MSNEIAKMKKMLDAAGMLCRSAGAIADRGGDSTDWAAFGTAVNAWTAQYLDFIQLPPGSREEFEAWILRTPHFELHGAPVPERKEFGYKDIVVHGAWLSHIKANAHKVPRWPISPSYRDLPTVPPLAACPPPMPPSCEDQNYVG